MAASVRFGIDGTNTIAIPIIATLGDGLSGLNGPHWENADPGPGTGYGSLTSLIQKTDELALVGREFQTQIAADHAVALEADSNGKYIRCRPEYLDDWRALFQTLLSTGSPTPPDENKPVPINYLQIDSEVDNKWQITAEGAEGFAEMVRYAHAAMQTYGGAFGTQSMIAGFNFGNRFLYLDDTPVDAQIWVDHVLEEVNGDFDILSLHPNYSWAGFKRLLAWTRATLDSRPRTKNKPIWADDMSSGPFYFEPWATAEELDFFDDLIAGDPATILQYAELQASYLIKKIAAGFAYGLDRIMLSTDVNNDAFPHPDEQWRYQGLITAGNNLPYPAGTKKPAFYSFKQCIDELDGFLTCEEVQAVSRQSDPPGELSGNVAYKFTFNGRGPTVVAWTEGAANGRLDVSRIFRGSRVEARVPVTSLNGSYEPVLVDSELCQSCRVPLTQVPVFISIP